MLTLITYRIRLRLQVNGIKTYFNSELLMTLLGL